MRRVVLVAFDGLQSLDLIGPNEVFSAASRLVPDAYRVEIVAPRRSFASRAVSLHAHPHRQRFRRRAA